MRVFTAIDLPENVLQSLELLLDDLRPTARLRWSPVRNMHITTKFIGEWPSARLEELIVGLRELPSPGEISVLIQGLGWFPNPRSPRVFWAGIEANEALLQLARTTEELASRLGIPEEKRTYSPHLTLARTQGPADLSLLLRAIEALPTTEFGKFTTAMHYLYQSQPGPGASRYTKISEFSL